MSADELRTAVPPDQQVSSAISRIVGIGSSAGGLEALQVVLRQLQIGQAVAYVIAQHVSPSHRSLMAELLDKETPLVVTPAADGLQMLPEHVYVTPPNADVTIVGDRMRLSTPLQGHGPRPSIDALFLSLAAQWGERAIAVLLSGTGDDGTYGMREIHAMGGLTIAQTPESAKYPAMPAAAIRAGVTDLVLLPERIGEAIVSAINRPAEPTPTLPKPFLHRVVEQLRVSGAGDFSQYKSGTLLRQIARRMSVLQLDERRITSPTWPPIPRRVGCCATPSWSRSPPSGAIPMPGRRWPSSCSRAGRTLPGTGSCASGCRGAPRGRRPTRSP